MRALIFEDETILANNIKLFLEHEEFESEQFDVVDIAENTAVALKLLKNDYDVVILDVSMPEVADDIQIVEALSLIRPQKHPWVFLITAHPSALQTAYISGKVVVQALLQKPFELLDLMGVIRELVKSRRQFLDSER